jgi:ABC-type nitrate/sulfonate/bicarbonate transport system substrate-binding protein
MKIRFSVLRGVCQTPAYVAHARGLFRAEGLEAELSVAPTAWQVPELLSRGACQFAVIPWTRIAAAEEGDAPLRVICGSGIEEAAVVVRAGLEPAGVKIVAVPREGGMKDLTAIGLLESLGWGDAELLRLPSGDGAILALVGGGADAASMVEPYATLMEVRGIGRVIRRTGDVWPGAPGCSLSARADVDPALAGAVVRAYTAAIARVHADPDDAAAIAARYIGVRADWIAQALLHNRPQADAVRNQDAMDRVLTLMQERGYLGARPKGYLDLRYLDAAQGRDARKVSA